MQHVSRMLTQKWRNINALHQNPHGLLQNKATKVAHNLHYILFTDFRTNVQQSNPWKATDTQ